MSDIIPGCRERTNFMTTYMFSMFVNLFVSKKLVEVYYMANAEALINHTGKDGMYILQECIASIKSE